MARDGGAVGRILSFKNLSLAVVLLIYSIIIVGGFVTATGAATACELRPTRYPLCNGSLVPDFSLPGVAQEYLHRQLTFWGGSVILLWLVQAWRTQRDRPILPRLATGTFLLLIVQSAIGALRVTVVEENPGSFSSVYPVVLTAHLALATMVFGMAVIVAMLAWTRPATAPAKEEKAEAPAAKAETVSAPAAAEKKEGPRRPEVDEPIPLEAGGWRDYAALTKPRIVFLLLVTTLTGFLMATGPAVDSGLLLATMVAGALVAGGSEALNGYLERDIDEKMRRTSRRPVPAGRVPPERALLFGLSLIGVSTLVFVYFVNFVALTFALAGSAFYVLVYTLYLKPRTAQNIVIGGAAGGFPVLVGWAAATGSLALPPLLLFILIFLWTPPHFWALAIVYEDDYRRAGVPMLPVVAGEKRTTRQIAAYSVVLVAFSLAFVLFGVGGILYAGAALVLGTILIYLSVRLPLGAGLKPASFRLFKFSGVYLLLLCVTLMVSALVPL